MMFTKKKRTVFFSDRWWCPRAPKFVARLRSRHTHILHIVLPHVNATRPKVVCGTKTIYLYLATPTLG